MHGGSAIRVKKFVTIGGMVCDVGDEGGISREEFCGLEVHILCRACEFVRNCVLMPFEPVTL